MPASQWTMLNAMAGTELDAALDKHVELGLHWVDLKNSIYGKEAAALTTTDATKAQEAITKRGLETYCLSTNLFHADVELGESHFRKTFYDKVAGIVKVAKILKPKLVRLLAATTQYRAEYTDSNAYLASEHSWIYALYRETIGDLCTAGCKVVIENEINNCILANPGEIVEFFTRIDRGGKAGYTWDVQNLWQMGTVPTLEVYQQLKPYILYYHLKGGMTVDGKPGPLKYASSLEDANWPLVEITEAVVLDGVSPVICLNPSHGEQKPGYDYSKIVERDLAYVRKKFGG